MRITLVAAALLAVVSFAYGQEDGLSYFKKDFTEAQKDAAKAEKPLYIHFTTDWCGWCRKIERDIYASDEGKKILADYVPVSLDCTKEGFNSKFMAKYGLSGYPTLLIVTADGAVLYTWAGYCPIDEFKAQLGKAQESLKAYTAFVKQAKEAKEARAKAAKEDPAATQPAGSGNLQGANKTWYDFNLKAMETFAKYQKWDDAAEAATVLRQFDAGNAKGDGAKADLVQIQAALFNETPVNKTKSFFDEIKKFDAKNEKGVLEQAYMVEAVAALKANRTKDAVTLLDELVKTDVKLKMGPQVQVMLAQAHYGLGDLKGALACVEKAMTLDPDPQMAEQLKKMQEALKAKIAE